MQQLLAGPRSSLTSDVVIASLDLSRGPKVRHGVTVLWATAQPGGAAADDPTGEPIRVEGGSVVWSYRPPDRVTGDTTDVAAVRRRADLVIVGPVAFPLAQRRYLIWTEFLAPSGVWVRWHLGVFVPTLPPASYDGKAVRYQLKLADKSWLWNTRNTPTTPLRLDAGENPVEWVRAQLGDIFGETSFALAPTSFVLDDAITFDEYGEGASWLARFNKALEAAAYDQLIADENGDPAAMPLADIAGRGAEVTYGPGAGKIVPAGDVEPLVDTLPNVVRFTARNGPSLAEEGNGFRTIRNPSTGPASIAATGDESWKFVDVTVDGQDELDALAAADAQRYFAGGGLRYSGKVGLNPRHADRDVVALDKPALGLSGVWQVTSWTYPLGRIDGSEDSILMPVTLEQRVTVEVDA